MQLNFIKLISVAVFTLMSATSFAQYNSWRFNEKTNSKKDKLKLFQRFDIGFHSSFSKTDYTYESGLINTDVVNNVTVESEERLLGYEGPASLTSFGGNIGLAIPVGKLGPKTTFGFNIDVYASFNSYEIKNLSFENGAQPSKNPKYDAMMLHVPVGLHVKWGGQSTLSKDDWASVGLSAGIAPTYISYSKNFVADDNMFVTPYLGAEFGFFTGVFWKIKGMILFDHYNMGVYNNRINNAYERATLLTNTNTFVLGLSFNLGSFGWQKSW